MSAEYHRAWYTANREAQAAKQKARRTERTPEQVEAEREYQRQYRQRNRDFLNEYDRQRNSARYAAQTPEQRMADLERQRRTRQERPELQRAANARAIAKHREKRAAAWKAWYEANKDHALAKAAARRALLLRATPTWSDLEAIRQVYAEAKRLEQFDGQPRHVDHVIPLKGRKVSGLHVAGNLQVLTKSENLRKSNRYDQEAA